MTNRQTKPGRGPQRLESRTMIPIMLEGITKDFGTTRAVDNVWLEVAAGELFFLLGPSGCGKTTLLRCVAGFCQPDCGRIRFGDRDITNVPAHKRDTGMVFQSYALWPHMTVADNVGFGLETRRFDRKSRQELVGRVLAMVRMGKLADRRPNQLSGGQQQRVALARALVVEPQCLLLDEPLSNLDAKLRVEMRGEIRRICKEAKLTAIYVTHDQKEALSMADRIAVLNAGRVEQIGTPVEIYRRPVTRFVAEFIGEANFVTGTVVEVANGYVTCQTGVGALTSASSRKDLHTGQTVTLLIRPEAIRLDTTRSTGQNLLGGHLVETVYLGEMAQHRLSLGEGQPAIKAYELNPRWPRQPGAIRCCVDPGDVVILAE